MPLDALEYEMIRAKKGSKKAKKNVAAQLKATAAQAKGKEAAEATAASQGLLQKAQQSTGNFGSEGLTIGAEDIARLRVSGDLKGTATAHTNKINLTDPAKAKQYEEIQRLGKGMGLSDEQISQALNQKLTMQNTKESLIANEGLTGNMQDYVNSAQSLKGSQMASAGKSLSTEQAILSNLAALHPTAYKEVNLNDPIHVMNLSKPLKMLQTDKAHGQQNMLKKDPSKMGWADVIGQQVLPAAFGAIMTAATAGALGPVAAGMVSGGAMGAIKTAQTGGDWGDLAKNMAMGVGSGAIGGIASGVGTGLTSGIGGMTGQVAGKVGSGLVSGFGGEALSMLEDGKFDIGSALTNSAISTGSGFIQDIGSDLLAGTKVGDALGLKGTELAPVPVDAAGNELGMADRFKAGFTEAGKNVAHDLWINRVKPMDLPDIPTPDEVTGGAKMVDYNNMYEPMGIMNIGGIGAGGEGTRFSTTTSFEPNLPTIEDLGGPFRTGQGGISDSPLLSPFEEQMAVPYDGVTAATGIEKSGLPTNINVGLGGLDTSGATLPPGGLTGTVQPSDTGGIKPTGGSEDAAQYYEPSMEDLKGLVSDLLPAIGNLISPQKKKTSTTTEVVTPGSLMGLADLYSSAGQRDPYAELQRRSTGVA